VCSAWVPCVALPSGGGSSAGSSPLCGSPVGGVLPCRVPVSRSPWHLFFVLPHARAHALTINCYFSYICPHLRNYSRVQVCWGDDVSSMMSFILVKDQLMLNPADGTPSTKIVIIRMFSPICAAILGSQSTEETTFRQSG